MLNLYGMNNSYCCKAVRRVANLYNHTTSPELKPIMPMEVALGTLPDKARYMLFGSATLVHKYEETRQKNLKGGVKRLFFSGTNVAYMELGYQGRTEY